jgi:hypothetical protein
MRILFGVIAFIGIIVGDSLVMAAPGLRLDKVMLEQQWTEGEASQSILHLGASSNWDGLSLGLLGKFYVVPIEDRYSSLNARLVFPKLNEDLVFRVDYDWDDKYKIYGTGVNYSCQPFQQTALEVGYKAEERCPELLTGCPYRLNDEMIGFTWEDKPWQYSFKLTRNDKEYYQNYPQYTLLKYQLGQAIGWHLRPNMRLQLEYQEDTGDYPAAGYKDFWKEAWTLKGEYGNSAKSHYSWEYSILDWDRGFEDYRDDQQINLKLRSELNSTTKVIFGAVYADLKYDSPEQDYSEPGVYYHPETDLNSRVVSKIGVEFQFNMTPYTLELGTFVGSFNYDSDSVVDTIRSGIYGTLGWQLHQVEFSLKVAPAGDLAHTDAYYQFEITYKPGKIVDD